MTPNSTSIFLFESKGLFITLVKFMINAILMKTFKFNCYLLISFLLVIGCKGPTTEKNAEQTKSPLEEFKTKAAEIMPNIADPTDIAILFELTAADYDPELVHDPLDWEKYKNVPLFAAANFGIYTADAIYQYAYNQMEPAYLSWMAAKSLAGELGFDHIFDEIVIKRIEGDYAPKDSLFNWIDEAIEQMRSTYSETDKLRIYTTLLSGNYIEKVHLVMGILFDSHLVLSDETKLLLNRELLFVLIEQLQSLEQLIDLIEQHETIEDTGYLSLELKKMRDIFLSFDLSAENLDNLTHDQIFKNEKLNELRNHVRNVRTFLIRAEVNE